VTKRRTIVQGSVKGDWEVTFRIKAPEGATYEQVEAWARYNVQENGELRLPMAGWPWDPEWFSVNVRHVGR
jgi:hypothetical protein